MAGVRRDEQVLRHLVRRPRPPRDRRAPRAASSGRARPGGGRGPRRGSPDGPSGPMRSPLAGRRDPCPRPAGRAGTPRNVGVDRRCSRPRLSQADLLCSGGRPGAEHHDRITVIVLAAGGGTRMKSKTMKVLHPIAGRSMIGHVLTAVGELEPHRVVAVVGHQREQVGPHIQRAAARRRARRAGDPGRHRPRGPGRLGGARPGRPLRHRAGGLRRHPAARGREPAGLRRATTRPPGARQHPVRPGRRPVRLRTRAARRRRRGDRRSSRRRTRPPSRPRSTRSTAASSPSTPTSSTRRCRG